MSNFRLVAFLFIVGLSIASADTVRSKRQAVMQNARTKCTTPDGGEGICKDLSLCRPYINLLRLDIQNQTVIRMIRSANRICKQPKPIVCCPTETYTLPTPEDGCGVAARPRFSADKIVGGQPARLGQYPWMALLYYTNTGNQPTPDCGGTLITNRHVLTAAHCVIRELSFVRLGEYDTSTDDETQHQDILIERAVRHPDFKRIDGHSDISVLYLQQHVEYTDNIRPICLPFYSEELRTRDYTGFNPFVVGWGYTENGGNRSDILMEVQIEIHANSICRTRYTAEKRNASERQFDNAILCAGNLLGERGDCSGDSGGPLMLPIRSRSGVAFHQFGIVSYGLDCARKGVPGVYASVQHFIDWIIERVSEPF